MTWLYSLFFLFPLSAASISTHREEFGTFAGGWEGKAWNYTTVYEYTLLINLSQRVYKPQVPLGMEAKAPRLGTR